MQKTIEKLYSVDILKSTLLPIDLYPIPSPFCLDKNNVKAFILGADPSNFSNKGITNILTTVFDLDKSDYRYFKGPLAGLEAIDIKMEEIYVQNLIRNYCKWETGQNKHWKEIASYWVEELKLDFDTIDPYGKIPVLLTAEILYHFLLNSGERKVPAADFYNCRVGIPIIPELNKLNRPLIPFYRYNRGKVNYWLNNPEWENYTKRIKSLVG